MQQRAREVGVGVSDGQGVGGRERVAETREDGGETGFGALGAVEEVGFGAGGWETHDGGEGDAVAGGLVGSEC